MLGGTIGEGNLSLEEQTHGKVTEFELISESHRYCYQFVSEIIREVLANFG